MTQVFSRFSLSTFLSSFHKGERAARQQGHACIKRIKCIKCFTSAVSPSPKGNTSQPRALLKEHLRKKAKIICSYALQSTTSLGA